MEENYIPSEEEYLKAKKVVDLYKGNQQKIYDNNLELIRKDLEEYFKNNLIEGIEIKEFELR